MKTVSYLERLIRHASWRYYNEPEKEPLMSDSKFDSLIFELKTLSPDSAVLKEIGASPQKNKFKHYHKMYSLDNGFNENDLEKWCNKFSNEVFVGSLKLDGASAALIYDQGILVRCVTRGDGLYGDLSPQLESIVPKTIKYPGLLQINGEIVIDEENFKRYSDEYSNPRNLAAGSLMTKDNPGILKERGAKFYAYDVIGLDFSERYSERLLILEEDFNFETMAYCKGNKNTMLTWYNQAINQRNIFNKDIGPSDGIVIRIDDIKRNNSLGYSEKYPKFAIAIKFPAESKIVKVLKIRWDISKNGVLTPVAEIEPVLLDGATISNVTLHNYRMMYDNLVGPGAEIEIIRSGGVIPKFIRTVKGTKPVGLIDCPYCGEPVADDEVKLYCFNKECLPRKVDFIVSFLEKLEYKGLAEKSIEKLLESGAINKLSDLFTLTWQGIGYHLSYYEEHAIDVYNSLQELKKVPYERLLYALNWDMVGKSNARKIAQKISFSKLLGLNSEKIFAVLVNIFGYGLTAQRIYDELEDIRVLIKELLNVDFEIIERKQVDNTKCYNIVITGTLSKPRKEIQDAINKSGHVAQGSITKDTDYLVVGENTGRNKLAKAEKYNVKQITEEELWKLL